MVAVKSPMLLLGTGVDKERGPAPKTLVQDEAPDVYHVTIIATQQAV